jgi:hypothetical protein
MTFANEEAALHSRLSDGAVRLSRAVHLVVGGA